MLKSTKRGSFYTPPQSLSAFKDTIQTRSYEEHKLHTPRGANRASCTPNGCTGQQFTPPQTQFPLLLVQWLPKRPNRMQDFENIETPPVE
eukprot:3905717-Amphidinium_carterae.2